jgi:hypothetical protein
MPCPTPGSKSLKVSRFHSAGDDSITGELLQEGEGRGGKDEIGASADKEVLRGRAEKRDASSCWAITLKTRRDDDPDPSLAALPENSTSKFLPLHPAVCGIWVARGEEMA